MKDGDKDCSEQQKESGIPWERMDPNRNVLNQYLKYLLNK